MFRQVNYLLIVAGISAVAAMTGATALGQAVYYDVWRGTSDDPAAASQIASWETATEADDSSALVGQDYYYWIRATQSQSNESNFVEFGAPILNADARVKVTCPTAAAQGNPVPPPVFRLELQIAHEHPLELEYQCTIRFYEDDPIEDNLLHTWEVTIPAEGGLEVPFHTVPEVGTRDLIIDIWDYDLLSVAVFATIEIGDNSASSWPLDIEVLDPIPYGPTITSIVGSGEGIHLDWIDDVTYNSGFGPMGTGTRPAAAPTNVAASDGDHADHVLVTWDSAPEATHYAVYRHLFDGDPNDAALARWWGSETYFEDTAVPAGTHYFYWVKAATGDMGEFESDFSASDEGWRAEDCNENGIPDDQDIANCDPNDPACQDCNGNGAPDECDIADLFSNDANGNGVPDECECEWRLVHNDDPDDPNDCPSPREGSAMAYDEARGVTVLFGGYDGAHLNDTWTWDGQTWTKVAPPGDSPSPRVYSAMVYDKARGEIVLFGGVHMGSETFSDTWVWDGAAWTLAADEGAGPSDRSDHAMAYDSAAEVVVLFGGPHGGGNETWFWDGVAWTQQTPGNQPDGQAGHAMAYDAARAVSIMFGGYRAAWNDSTWTWDGVDWAELTPLSHPAGRGQHAMNYVASIQRTIMFGGFDNLDVNNDETWSWDGQNWLQLPIDGPSARHAHAMSYDSARGAAVLYGGAGQCFHADFKGDTWEFGPPVFAPDCNGNGIPDDLELAGQFGFASHVDYDTQDYPTWITSAELDGDDDIDVVVSNESSNTVSVFWNDGTGQFPERTDYPVGSHPAGVGAADLNRDGYNDIAVVNGHGDTVSILLNDGAGSFLDQVNYSTGNRPCSMVIADLDGDDWPDLAVTNRDDDTVSVLMNDGAGAFIAGASWPVGNHPAHLAAGDFDGDGDQDLAAGNHYDSSLTVLFNNNGEFGERTDYTVASGPSGIVVADLDGDADIDIAVSCQSSWVSILLNQGAGTFDAAVNWPAGGMSTGMTGADFDLDGDIDLAAANYTGDNVSILLNDGNAAFTEFTCPAGDGAYFVTSADLDGDADDDLAVTNVHANNISVLINVSMPADPDCNANGRLDECDISEGISSDTNCNGVPDECDCLGDLDSDGDVDLSDLAQLLANYGVISEATYEMGDMNCDGDVDLSDLASLLSRYGIAC